MGFLPLNLGPLLRAGGYRRLNVAVTRAQRQVLLFASFDPSDLRAEQTSSIGVKDLKSNLEMAASGSDALEAGPAAQQSSTATETTSKQNCGCAASP
jgi:hypothetical protein